MTTQRQIEEACVNIERNLVAFQADMERVHELHRCLIGLSWLREQYRQDKTVLELYMIRIKELSRRVHEALAAARERLTAKYIEAHTAVQAWENTRDACREAMIELSVTQNVAHFDCPQGSVEVKQARAMVLPKPNTPQRDQLSAIITAAGRWNEVGAPNATRLANAVESGLFAPEQVQEIARLCPTQTTYRVAGHSR